MIIFKYTEFQLNFKNKTCFYFPNNQLKTILYMTLPNKIKLNEKFSKPSGKKTKCQKYTFAEFSTAM